jgi:hypothetical protein
VHGCSVMVLFLSSKTNRYRWFDCMGRFRSDPLVLECRARFQWPLQLRVIGEQMHGLTVCPHPCEVDVQSGHGVRLPSGTWVDPCQSLFDLKKRFSMVSTARGDFVSVDELTRLGGIEEPAS